MFVRNWDLQSHIDKLIKTFRWKKRVASKRNISMREENICFLPRGGTPGFYWQVETPIVPPYI